MIILCADDYAINEGVSRAIGELAAARRLSATSVLVTSPCWPGTAPRLLVHRGRLSIGLHFDLTLGTPLGPMPRLAPNGRFPPLARLLAWSLVGLVDSGEIKAEANRQLDRFEAGLGFQPDHIDGHQHVQVLPYVRQALLEVVSRRYWKRPPLIRDPSDSFEAIRTRGACTGKAMTVAALALGFSNAARRWGLTCNRGFSGFSRFDVDEPYAGELERALAAPGPCHIVMCHPGHADRGTGPADAIAARRPMEYEALMGSRNLPERIWRPSRTADGPPLVWPEIAT